ncbi:tumor necrosis factor receptor superfamily member 27 [Rhineura floridana]|uniref:tumor necrosis factor receptor superfamily member 27 n=1 Tax=Rhineura floridana TaxID=261503 RepID=UPI002AC85694|nr:tumor necrosis factor receptor superfamily member 27 [Rhineura floridana]XP_061454166.1 tumor necrosis factor receptor superfamily member 27 [Rhineura floridana]XP_061454167.1 tumor necrosis factor receptor superfamily member 27 [Rhineura floridana]XP_061454168.1 tumor necrosis factor receptor superfamily member 27 [Rhineura floridana]
MKKEAALVLMLMFVMEVPQLPANPTECRESEYLDDQGKCTPCKECGPGLELSKQCGYGEGSNAQCTPCHPKRFKDSWGHHGCKPCLSCSLINRIQKSNCTATSDAACGECFPGFYRKTQIGGSRDQECVPCTKQTPSSELQCRSRVSLVKVEVPTAPAQDLILVVLTSSAVVVIVLVLLTVSILCCRRFWKSHCQCAFLRSQSFSGQRVMFQASAMPAGFPCREPLSSSCCVAIKSLSPCQRLQEGPAETVQFVSGVSGLHLPCQQSDQDLSKFITASPKAPLARSLLETQPLIRNSGCSDWSAGGSSLTELRQDCCGEDPDSSPAPLSSCATVMQHHWPHTPVECTELDLQKFSTQAEFMDTSGKEDHGNRAAQGDEAQSLVTEIGDITQGLPIAGLPDSLVLSLALQLDLPLPGLKNFSHVGMELGIVSHQLSQMSGFKELVAYLADSGNSLPVLILAQALQKHQRFDALLLLYDHFIGNQTQTIQL